MARSPTATGKWRRLRRHFKAISPLFYQKCRVSDTFLSPKNVATPAKMTQNVKFTTKIRGDPCKNAQKLKLFQPHLTF